MSRTLITAGCVFILLTLKISVQPARAQVPTPTILQKQGDRLAVTVIEYRQEVRTRTVPVSVEINGQVVVKQVTEQYTVTVPVMKLKPLNDGKLYNIKGEFLPIGVLTHRFKTNQQVPVLLAKPGEEKMSPVLQGLFREDVLIFVPDPPKQTIPLP